MESLMKTQGTVAAPRAQGKPRRPWAQKVPPPEEENPRMKCRECGSFGHTEKSKRCPIKCGHVIVISQPVRARSEKENQHPGRSQGLQKPGSTSQAKRDKKPSQGTGPRGDEQQREAPFQKFPIDPRRRDQHVSLAHTKMPVFSPGNTKKHMIGLVETTVPTAKTPPGKQMCLGNPARQSFDASCILPSRHEGGQNTAVPGVTKQNGRNAASENLDQKRFLHQHPAAAVPKRNGIGQVFHGESKVQGPSGKTQPSQHPALHQDTQNPKLSLWVPRNKASRHFPEPSQSVRKKPRVSSPNRPGESDARTVLKAFPGSPSPPIGNRLELKAAAEMSKEIAAQVPSTQNQQLQSRAALLSSTPCAESHPPSAGRVARQALRMVFTKLHSDCWSSRFLTVSPELATETQTAPPESPAFPEEGEAAGSQVPRSVLYEDLQVSSSSEDSDGE